MLPGASFAVLRVVMKGAVVFLTAAVVSGAVAMAAAMVPGVGTCPVVASALLLPPPVVVRVSGECVVIAPVELRDVQGLSSAAAAAAAVAGRVGLRRLPREKNEDVRTKHGMVMAGRR